MNLVIQHFTQLAKNNMNDKNTNNIWFLLFPLLYLLSISRVCSEKWISPTNHLLSFLICTLKENPSFLQEYFRLKIPPTQLGISRASQSRTLFYLIVLTEVMRSKKACTQRVWQTDVLTNHTLFKLDCPHGLKTFLDFAHSLGQKISYFWRKLEIVGLKCAKLS